MASRSQLTLFIGVALIALFGLTSAAGADPAPAPATPATEGDTSAAPPPANEPAAPPVGCPYRPNKLELIV
jgi:hypothetical protein